MATGESWSQSEYPFDIASLYRMCANFKYPLLIDVSRSPVIDPNSDSFGVGVGGGRRTPKDADCEELYLLQIESCVWLVQRGLLLEQSGGTRDLVLLLVLVPIRVLGLS